MKKMLVASTSTVYGSGFLEYLRPQLGEFFAEVRTVLFIPFARPDGLTHDEYTEKARAAFIPMGKEVKGLHEFDDMGEALRQAEAIFTGGGNTFVLVDQLHRSGLMSVLREVVFSGVPYLGCSAGSNITGVSMQTTNDMPIVYPPSFKTLGALPFNLNPHYLDPVPGSTHMGETRETRIAEFHSYNELPVLGLREGSYLEVAGEEIILGGTLSARVFQKGQPAFELPAGSKVALS